MFVEYTLDNWKEWDKIKELIVPMDKWCFRGQGDSDWGLKSTIERPFIKGPSLQEFTFDETQFDREKKILFHFTRGVHNYNVSLPEDKSDDLDWLSLIQHHGGLTRLLDFTYSLYIAAYFAVSSAVKQSSIWAINLFLIESLVKNKFGIKYNSHEEKIVAHQQLVEDYINNNKEENLIINIEPTHLNNRMSIQKGLFLFPCNIEVPFEYNLSKMFDMKHENIYSHFKKVELNNLTERNLRRYLVVKINFPKKTQNAIKYDLIKMNITSATLFPGLDGFARSLGQYFYKSDQL